MWLLWSSESNLMNFRTLLLVLVFQLYGGRLFNPGELVDEVSHNEELFHKSGRGINSIHVAYLSHSLHLINMDTSRNKSYFMICQNLKVVTNIIRLQHPSPTSILPYLSVDRVRLKLLHTPCFSWFTFLEWFMDTFDMDFWSGLKRKSAIDLEIRAGISFCMNSLCQNNRIHDQFK